MFEYKKSDQYNALKRFQSETQDVS